MSKMQKIGVTDFVLEIKRVKNYPDFEKLAHVIQVSIVHRSVWLRILKESQRRQTILVILCRVGSVA